MDVLSCPMNIPARPLSPLESTLTKKAPVAVPPSLGLLRASVSPWEPRLRGGLGEGGATFKRSNVQTCQRKSFRMHSYEIAYALTLLESHSYRKTGGVGGQPPTFPQYWNSPFADRRAPLSAHPAWLVLHSGTVERPVENRNQLRSAQLPPCPLANAMIRIHVPSGGWS